MHIARKPHPVAMFSAWFLVVFLVLFPKGGIKVANIPLTWGYLFLAISAPPLIAIRLLATPLLVKRTVLAVLGILLPVQILIIYTVLTYGIYSMGFFFSTFTGLFVIPWMFLLLYPPFLKFIDGERLARYLRWCIFIAAVWGIFLFFWHTAIGSYIEIPYLTVNADDFGQLERTKHIARGLFYKLISTYNNGNLYGVATLILFPLYSFHEKVRWRRATVWLAVLLTLSRTVWAGLILMESLPLVTLAAKQIKSFPRLYLKTAVRQIVAVSITVALILGALLFNSSSLSFLLDPTLGGRNVHGTLHPVAGFLPSQPLDGFSEIVYISAISVIGYAGMIAIVLIFASPLLLLIVDRSALDSPSRTAALKGLVLYMFLAGADGGINYIPVMAFYWFTYMIYLFGWPSSRSALADHSSQPAVVEHPGALHPGSLPEKVPI